MINNRMCIADAILDYAAAHSNGSFVMNDASNDPGLAGIFSTYPSAWLSIPGGIGDQVIFSLTRQLFFFWRDWSMILNGFNLNTQIFGTFLLLLAICAITDRRNNKIPDGLVPMYIGFVIVAIGIAYGANCGYALNPARDLGPRLFSLIAGWKEAFRLDDIFFCSLSWCSFPFHWYLVTKIILGFGFRLLDLILEPFWVS